MPSVKWNYFLIFLLLLSIEILIAVYKFHYFIRGFMGDVLVILLMYSFLKIFIRKNVLKIAVSVLAFAILIEFLQYYRIVEILNIQSKVLRIVMGSVFDLWDIVAYFVGFVVILLNEKIFRLTL